MSNIENTTSAFLSLADLAAMQTDEIATLTSRLPEAGMFTVRGTGVKASESAGKEEGQPPLFRFGFGFEVLEAQPLDKNKDPESFIGKTLRESYTLWPSDFAEAIGLLKGRYQAIKLANTGALGGVEGMDPGWLDNITGHVFRVRIRHFESKSGTRAGFDWLPYEDGAAA